MKRHSYLWIIVLIMACGTSFAHQDFWVKKNYGNIEVRVKTGFEYEEINKAFIIGQLAEKLAKDLNYSNQIFLDFNHHYTANCDPDYFISYDKGGIQYIWRDDKKKNFLKENAIVVRQVSRIFDVLSTLKLLEYAIKNVSSIKTSQKQIEYKLNYCQWKINSIDTTFIKEQLSKPNSESLKQVIKLKIERPDKDFKYGISYYWQDNKFHLFLRGDHKADTTLINLNNIYDIKKFGNSSAIVFDTDSSFFYIYQYNKPIVSKRQIILSTNGYYEPFKMESISEDEISIYFWYYIKEQSKERTLIYLTKKDELIEDLDKLIDKR
ncbi:MAG: hypothetical protein ABI723_24675 [Bacteroidia bacterium]